MMLILVLVAQSCVYPFNVDIEGQSGTMVIEGNILIGEVMPVYVTYTAPIGSNQDAPEAPSAQVWVECDDGTVYPGMRTGTGSYEVDVRDADPSLQYRLRVQNMNTGKDYVSTWQEVHKPASIDSLSYSLSEARDKLFIELSMHSQGESWFKWSYEEEWEYHSDYYSILSYSPPVKNTPTWNNGFGIMENRPDTENIYYCWNHDVSNEIMIFSTDTQTEDRFVDLEFHTLGRTDRKISSLYHINVSLEAISRDAYVYWDNVKSNSEYSGSLFAPNPSEMIGNIRCVSDTTEFVIGYISAALRATKGLFIDNTVTRFYKSSPLSEEEVADVPRDRWEYYHKLSWLPVMYPDPDGNPNTVTWAVKKCVDCRARGGSKKKPDYWPNNHL